MNAIETHALTRRFGDLVAVDQLTLSIPAGTVFGFLGPNGAGKTTTVRMLAALIAPTGGAASVNGQPLGDGNQAIRLPIKNSPPIGKKNTKLARKKRPLLRRSGLI